MEGTLISSSLQKPVVYTKPWFLALACIGLVPMVALVTRLLSMVNQARRLLDCVDGEKPGYVGSVIPEIAEIDAYELCDLRN